MNEQTTSKDEEALTLTSHVDVFDLLRSIKWKHPEEFKQVALEELKEKPPEPKFKLAGPDGKEY